MCKTASPSEALVELIRTAGLEKTFAEFPEDVLEAARGAMRERDKMMLPCRRKP
jgi:hypothetical protein